MLSKTTVKVYRNKKPVSNVLFVIDEHNLSHWRIEFRLLHSGNYVPTLYEFRYEYNWSARLFERVCKPTKA